MSTFALNIVFVQEGEFYAHSAAFGITSLIPKTFLNQSFEAEEAAKELTIQAAKKSKTIQAAKKSKAEEKAKSAAKKSAVLKQVKITDTKQKTHQKPAKDKEQTTSAPAKEDAPVTAAQHPTEACLLDLPSGSAYLIYLLTRRCTAL